MNHCSFLNVSLSLCISCFQFAEKFQEVKDAAKLARDKSQEKVETLSNHSQVNDLSLSLSLPSDALIQSNTADENQQQQPTIHIQPLIRVLWFIAQITAFTLSVLLMWSTAWMMSVTVF